MGRLKQSARITKRAVKKLSGRSFSNFHNGHSLPVVVYKASRYTLRKGPRQTARVIKQRVLTGLSPHLSFPNGLVSGVEIQRIKDWYNHKAKKVSLIIPSY